jgi:hypothetical protein
MPGCYTLIIKLNGKYELSGSTGKEIMKAKFDKIRPLNNMSFLPKSNSKNGIISADGKEIIPPKNYENSKSYQLFN